MEWSTVERATKTEVNTRTEFFKKEWASSSGLCRRHKPYHPHHVKVSPRGPRQKRECFSHWRKSDKVWRRRQCVWTYSFLIFFFRSWTTSLAPFGERKFAERKRFWTVEEKWQTKEWCVSSAYADWLIADCHTNREEGEQDLKGQYVQTDRFWSGTAILPATVTTDSQVD